MLPHPQFLALLCLSALFAQASEPTSHAPVAVTHTKPAAIPSAADELVDQLVRNAAALHTTLPSITAHELVHTDATTGVRMHHSQAEGTVHMSGAVSGGLLEETHQIATFNKKPVAPGNPVVIGPPIDAFTGLMEKLFSRANRPCFAFSLAPQPAGKYPLKLRISLSPDYASRPGCARGLEGLTGVALVDPATHRLTHLEQAVPTEGGRGVHFVSTDYAPVGIGDNTFWLPISTLSADIQGKSRTYTSVYYSDYHRYAAKVTVLSAASR